MIVGTLPQLVNYLPNRFYLSSYNAPPPQNPKLQACVEEYLSQELIAQRADMEMAIAALDKVDFSSLPQKMATSLQETSENAYSVYDRLDDVNADLAVLAETEVTFANMHADVRYLERQMRSIERELKKAKKQERRTDDLDEKSDIASDILILEDEYAALESQILLNEQRGV